MSYNHRHLTCLDSETVPDTEALPEGFDPAEFPKTPFHKVVAISLVEADIIRSADGTEWFRVTGIGSCGREDSTEAQLLKGFWSYWEKRRPRAVTWNGRAFDMQVLRQRAMVHGVSASAWYNAGDRRFATYGHRFSPDWHCDLADVLADYGSSRMVGLEDMARALGLPGKIGGHGSHVADMIGEGRIGQARAYCEVDALNLFPMYVRWMTLAGKTTPQGHNRSIQSLIDYLERERRERPYLGEFLEKWRASTRPVPMFVPEDEAPAAIPPAEHNPPPEQAAEPEPVSRATGRRPTFGSRYQFGRPAAGPVASPAEQAEPELPFGGRTFP